MKCINCQSKLIKEAIYCSSCGQSTADLNRPFGHIAKEMLHEILDIDNKLWLTLKTLMTKPGKLTKEFSLGMRAKYTPPLRLYLVVSIIFFVFFNAIYHVYGNLNSDISSMGDHYAKAMFVLFPVFALIIQLFFRKSFYLYNLIFSMHIHSVVYLCLMVIAPLEAFEHISPILLLFQLPPTIYLIWYIFTAFKTMFDEKWPLTIIKASAIYLIYMGMLGIVFDVVFKYIV